MVVTAGHPNGWRAPDTVRQLAIRAFEGAALLAPESERRHAKPPDEEPAEMPCILVAHPLGDVVDGKVRLNEEILCSAQALLHHQFLWSEAGGREYLPSKHGLGHAYRFCVRLHRNAAVCLVAQTLHQLILLAAHPMHAEMISRARALARRSPAGPALLSAESRKANMVIAWSSRRGFG